MIAQLQDITEVRAYRERLEDLVARRTRELHHAKDEAERASQAKSWFLTHMSHEIRSPLQVMVLNAAALEGDRSLTAEQVSCIESIQSSGEHLATLINNVLDMSTVESGRLALVETRFDVTAILDETAQMFAAQAAATGTDLRVEVAPGLRASLLGDGGKVKQIVINLVSNAIKFTRWGSVSASPQRASPGADPTALVRDRRRRTRARASASGTSLEYSSRSSNSRAGPTAGGTGLGLTISLAYARLMGGDITVESHPGAGSRFKLTFFAKREDRAGRGSHPDRSPLSRPSHRRE